MGWGKLMRRVANTVETKAKIDKINAETARIKADTDLMEEVNRQAENKTEKTGLTVTGNQQKETANNAILSKGSVLSRLKTARMALGTPNSNMGSDGNLGAFIKDEFLR